MKQAAQKRAESSSIPPGITGVEMQAFVGAQRFVSHFRSLPDEQIREKWIALIDRAISQFRGADQRINAADGGHVAIVGTPDTVAGGGHSMAAQEGQAVPASARIPSSEHTVAGGGQASFAHQGQSHHAPAGSPRPVAGLDQKPLVAHSDQLRDVRGRASERKLHARTVTLARSMNLFDTKKTSDGRSWGDVFVHELPGMGRDGAMAKALLHRIGSLPTNDPKRVREALKLSDFEGVCTQVELANAD